MHTSREDREGRSGKISQPRNNCNKNGASITNDFNYFVIEWSKKIQRNRKMTHFLSTIGMFLDIRST